MVVVAQQWNTYPSSLVRLKVSGKPGAVRLPAKRLFIRLTENTGQNHDAAIELAGSQQAFEDVAGACGWTTLSLTKDDCRSIQTLLNAGGELCPKVDGAVKSGFMGVGCAEFQVY